MDVDEGGVINTGAETVEDISRTEAGMVVTAAFIKTGVTPIERTEGTEGMGMTALIEEAGGMDGKTEGTEIIIGIMIAIVIGTGTGTGIVTAIETGIEIVTETAIETVIGTGIAIGIATGIVTETIVGANAGQCLEIMMKTESEVDDNTGGELGSCKLG